jgi:hypothetical protein
MSNISKFLTIGILIEAVAILIFIGISKTTLAVLGKQVTIIASLIVIIIFLIAAVKIFAIRELLLLSTFLTIGAIVIQQILGYVFFPGIVKDIKPFSLDHVVRIGMSFILVLGSYVGTIFLIAGIKKIFKF